MSVAPKLAAATVALLLIGGCSRLPTQPQADSRDVLPVQNTAPSDSSGDRSGNLFGSGT